MVRIHFRPAVLALILAPLMASCAATPTTSTSSTPPSSTTSSAPSPSNSPSTTTSAPGHDLQTAQQAVVTLWATVDRLVNDPRLSLQGLDNVATGKALTMFQQNLGKYRAAQWVGSGSSTVTDPQIVSSGVDAQGDRSWTVTACVDGSRTTLVDRTGKSVQGPPYRIRHKATVVSRAAHLYVSDDQATGTC